MTAEQLWSRLDDGISSHCDQVQEIQRFFKAQIACLDATVRLGDLLRQVQEHPQYQATRATLEQSEGALAAWDGWLQTTQAVRSQWQRGYPILHSLVAVGLWAQVEACVRDTAGEWIGGNRRALLGDKLKNVKIHARVLTGDDAAISTAVVEAIEQSIKDNSGNDSRGISQLENLLERSGIGTSPSLSKDTKKDLNELWAVRNLIAHRAGRVDTLFRARAPWVNAEVGMWHYPRAADIERYTDSTIKYLGLVWGRAERACAALKTERAP